MIFDTLALCQPAQLIQVTPCGRIASIASGCHSIAPEGFLDLRALKEFGMGLAGWIYLMAVRPQMHLGLKMSALSLLLSVGDHIFSRRHLSLRHSAEVYHPIWQRLGADFIVKNILHAPNLCHTLRSSFVSDIKCLSVKQSTCSQTDKYSDWACIFSVRVSPLISSLWISSS